MDNTFENARFFVYINFLRLRWCVVQAITILVLVLLLLWMSVFLYGTFYYMYMPVVSHDWPVHLRFRKDCETSRIDHNLCSFPSANITMTTSNQKPILVHGQSYIVSMDMEMPESLVNQNLGMFMVEINFYSKFGDVIYTSGRSVMMQYKSLLYQTLETIFYLPSLLLKTKIQKQTVFVEFTNDYYEDPYKPTVGASIEVQSKKIEIYKSSFKIQAKFTGLRYFLFYWPTLSALLGMASNFFFLSVLALFSWIAFFTKSTSDLRNETNPSGESSKSDEIKEIVEQSKKTAAIHRDEGDDNVAKRNSSLAVSESEFEDLEFLDADKSFSTDDKESNIDDTGLRKRNLW